MLQRIQQVKQVVPYNEDHEESGDEPAALDCAYSEVEPGACGLRMLHGFTGDVLENSETIRDFVLEECDYFYDSPECARFDAELKNVASADAFCTILRYIFGKIECLDPTQSEPMLNSAILLEEDDGTDCTR